ncbi:hypothetical protein FRD01_15575 [Microvenator marinus]|jgi:flagellar biosynthesis chaperone FliJ|uniref:Flagellar FliJ protein n=1 Tax=Microvenator marinus TaxID=2600177 RepID=A0A5B8XUM5_9DELT|nr:hypothetical protein [Microvenator marinus]QED28628.1 hypothetical protein FRD01_15575 [Microvenator marinus]
MGRRTLSKKLVKLAEIDAQRAQERQNGVESELNEFRLELKNKEKDLERLENERQRRASEGVTLGQLMIMDANLERLRQTLIHDMNAISRMEDRLASEKNRALSARKEVDRAEKVSQKVAVDAEKKKSKVVQRALDDRAAQKWETL